MRIKIITNVQKGQEIPSSSRSNDTLDDEAELLDKFEVDEARFFRNEL